MRTALALLIVVSWTASGCGGDGGGSPSDGGADAAADASMDGSADASMDGSTDGSTDAGTDAGAPCDPEAGQVCDEGPYNYAFVTSDLFVPGELGSVAGADAKCNAAAAAAGLPGTYIAWVSSSTSNAIDRLGSASGWLRTDRRPFALSVGGLVALDIRYPLDIDENGQRISDADDTVVPTGTNADGTASGDDCMGWTDMDASGRASGGYAFAGSMRWSQGFLPQCIFPTRLYCFGTDETGGVTVTPPTASRMAFLSQAPLAGDAGLAAADALCAGEASDHGLTGTFLALMATSTATAASRFDDTGAPWVRHDGSLVWASAAGLSAGDLPLAPIMLYADGSRATALRAWTGAEDAVSLGSDDCDDWSATTDATMMPLKSYFGAVDLASSWFGSGPIDCSTNAVRVYCLEQ